MTETPLTVGLLGAGRIGSFHAATLRELPAVGALTIHDPLPGRAGELARELGATVARTPEELIRSVDAVVIASATPTHADLLRAALDAGIPAFCEKPIAPGLAETEALVRAVEESGVPVTVGFQRRSDPAYRELRRRLRDGELGTPYLVRMVVGDDAPPPADYVAGSGGIFHDQSVHDFDVVRWLTGQEITEVCAFGANLTGAPGFADAGDIDTAATVMRLSGGTLAVLTSSRHSAGGYDVRLEIAGSSQVAAVGMEGAPSGDAVAVAAAPGGGFVTRFAAAYRAEMRRFVELAAGHGDNPCEVRDALAALRAAAAVTVSRLENRPVKPEGVR